MANKFWLVLYEDDRGEQSTCVVVSPNERLIPKFMYPYEVLNVAVLDEMDLEVHGGSPSDNVLRSGVSGVGSGDSGVHGMDSGGREEESD